jgi:hypothetical protein
MLAINNRKNVRMIDLSDNYIIESGVTASGFSLLDEEDFDDLGLTKIGKKLVLKILPESK